MKSALQRYYRALRFLPKALGGDGRRKIARHVIAPVKRRASQVIRFVLVRQTRPVDVLFGRRAGNIFFWASPTIPKLWDHVERRLFMLDARDRDALRQFVDLTLQKSEDFVVWTNLARSDLTTEYVAARLSVLDLKRDSALAKRICQSHILAASLVGASSLALEEAEAERVAEQVRAILPAPTQGYTAAIDSLGALPASKPRNLSRRCLPESGFQTPKRHRLIVAANLSDHRSISLLFNGANKVTLFAMHDLYGSADFTDQPQHCHAGIRVMVEHSRSRITRFSSDYHALHEETKQVAQELHTALAAAAPDIEWMPAGSRPFAELNLADRLFFPALTLSALRKLVADQDFDHIVIAADARKTDRDFCAMLSGLEELRTDTRVEVVSTARSTGERLIFNRRLAEFRGERGGGADTRASYWGLPVGMVADAIHEVGRETAPPPVRWAGNGKSKVLLLCSASGAYNASTAAYLEAMVGRYDLGVGFMGSNILPILSEGDLLSELHPDDLYTMPISISSAGQMKLHGLRLWLRHFLAAAVLEMDPSIAAHLLSVRADYFVREALLSFFVAVRASEHWFAAMAREGGLPDLVILTPYRDAFVAQHVAAARRLNVPTLAVEPHGLNSNYCRYANILADHSGVVSSYFLDEAASGFAIPRDRCHVTGSPRMTAPAEYDLTGRTAAARQTARAKLGLDLTGAKATLVFFSQPCTWDQLAVVWHMLLDAAQPLDVQVILKTHPEETPTRVAQYLEIASGYNMPGRVMLWKGGPKEAIECADIVLSAYSATVVEAATLRRPVICLAGKGVDYPLDQHSVIDAPLLRDADELAAMLRDFLHDPAPMRAKAVEFVQKERHITEGLAPSLGRVIDDIIATPASEAIRPLEEVPDTCFLKGPHRSFLV